MEFYTLNTLLARDGGKLPSRALYMLMHPLVEILMEWRDDGIELENVVLNEDTIAFSSDYKNIQVLAASSNEQENVAGWGKVWLNIINTTGSEKSLEKIARQCVEGEITTLEELHLALERKVNRFIYKLLLVIILVGLAILAIMHFKC